MNLPVCTVSGRNCYNSLFSKESFCPDLVPPCQGFYLDMKILNSQESAELISENIVDENFLHEYEDYKGNMINTEGWPLSTYLTEDIKGTKCTSKFSISFAWYILDHVLIPNLTMTYVNIYFDTKTMDEITYTMKTDFELKLSTIGGTMGLFTGFSLLSSVEIFFHLGKFCYTILKNYFVRRHHESIESNVESTSTNSWFWMYLFV